MHYPSLQIHRDLCHIHALDYLWERSEENVAFLREPSRGSYFIYTERLRLRLLILFDSDSNPLTYLPPTPQLEKIRLLLLLRFLDTPKVKKLSLLPTPTSALEPIRIRLQIYKTGKKYDSDSSFLTFSTPTPDFSPWTYWTSTPKLENIRLLSTPTYTLTCLVSMSVIPFPCD